MAWPRYRADKWQNYDSNPASLTADLTLLASICMQMSCIETEDTY